MFQTLTAVSEMTLDSAKPFESLLSMETDSEKLNKYIQIIFKREY